MCLKPWQLSFDDAASFKGRSKMVDVIPIIQNFLQSGYESERDPLEVVFHPSPGVLVEPFSVCYVLGMGKALACLAIMEAVVRLQLSDAEIQSLPCAGFPADRPERAAL